MDERGGEGRKLAVLGRRLEFLERLGEGPAYKRDLVDEMDHSRSTINRALGELEDVGLVERGDEGFVATTAGRLAAERYGSFRRELADIVAADDVLDPLPAGEAVGVEFVAGSDAALSTDPAPYRPLERFHDALADADRYRAVLPALDDPRHVRLLYEHVVTRERPAELVVAPALFDALREEFPRRAAAMADAGSFSVHVGEVPPYALALVDGTDAGEVAEPGDTGAWAVVFAESGAVHGVLENGTAAGVRWAERRYETALASATERTDELRPDADGGVATDADGGVALPPTDGTLSVALERAGFVRLGTAYFREEPVADPTTAWRAGLSIPEVHTGYAVERTPGDGEGPLADRLRSKLVDGTDCVVVGPPGSGKSTTCKRVACEWYDADRGPVLYREQGRGRPFDSVEDLVVTVDVADGHTLVVVEDAVRPEADVVFEAADRLADRDDVSFLFDARASEWTDPPGDSVDVTGFEVVTMPALDDRDAGRLVEHFERTADASVGVPADRLLERVRDEAAGDDESAPNEVLLLLHRLATYVDPLTAGETSLEGAVAAVYEAFAGDGADDDVALDVCVLANVLNAAGVEFDVGLLYAVAEPAAFDAVDAAIDRLAGRVLFQRPDGSYRAVHESWSAALLAHLLDAEGEAAAAERFGGCVSALLALADDPGRRTAIGDHLDREWVFPGADDVQGWAEATAAAAFDVGQERPKLAPLYGDGSDDSVTLPDAVGADFERGGPAWLGQLFLKSRDYDRAERAFERLRDGDLDDTVERHIGLAGLAKARGEYDEALEHCEACLDVLADADRPADLARVRLTLGQTRVIVGDLATARADIEAALDGYEAMDDQLRAARAVNSLGEVAYRQGEFGTAGDHFQRSLELAREIGHVNQRAMSLGNLGIVASRRGDYEQAREYHERALELDRTRGDRSGEASTLINLGEVAKSRGRHERAREFYERSLELARDLGQRTTEAISLNNLGVIASRRGDYERAREYQEGSLELERETGNRRGEAISLDNLGDVARARGDHERARQYQERHLELMRDVGDSRGEAGGLNELGILARLRGDHERAREYHEQGLEVARAADDRLVEARCLDDLGKLAIRRGAPERARERFEQADAVADGSRDRFENAKLRVARGRLALELGDADLAHEHAATCRREFAAMDATHWEARTRRLLGRVAAERADHETARERFESALDTFEDVGAPRDALATLEHLVETCEQAGDDGAALAWAERAEGLVDDAPDAVADRHREWVGRALDDLAGG